VDSIACVLAMVLTSMGRRSVARTACALSLIVPSRSISLGPPLMPLIDSYQQALLSSPLETKVATAAVLAVAGDAIAQRAGKAPYDRARAGSFVLFDAAYRGGFQHAAFPWIIDHCRGDALLAATAALPVSVPLADQSLLAAVECTAFNQLLVVPIVYYPLFFGITGAVQGLSAEESLARARSRFVSLTLRNWQFWIPVQFVQFNYLPEEWQVPYTCAMGLVWNVILSAAAGSAREPESAEEVVGMVVPTSKAESAVPSGTGAASKKNA